MKKSINKIVTVYLIYDKTRKKEGYIGQTTDFSVNSYCKQYVTFAKKQCADGSYEDNSHRGRAIRKCKFNVGFKIIDVGTEKIWNIAEIAWIAKYKSNGWNLWNETEGGDGVLGCKPWNKNKQGHLSKKSTEALSKSLKDWHERHPGALAGKNNPMFNVSPWNKGMTLSEERSKRTTAVRRKNKLNKLKESESHKSI